MTGDSDRLTVLEPLDDGGGVALQVEHGDLGVVLVILHVAHDMYVCGIRPIGRVSKFPGGT